MLRYALLAVLRRFRRNFLTLAAMTVGAASLVALIGITESSVNHTALRMTQYEAANVQVRLQPYAWEWGEQQIIEAARQLPEVAAVGTLSLGEVPEAQLSSIYGGSSQQAYVTVASSQGLDAREAEIVEGSYPLGESVLLGKSLARDLGVSSQQGRNRIVLDGQEVTVSGIVVDGPHNAALSTMLVLPPDSSLVPSVKNRQRALHVRITPGSADLVGQQLPMVLDPGQPLNVTVASAPSPSQLKESLGADSRILVRVVLLVMVVATSFGTVLTMQMSVWERRREIGISRALGLGRLKVLTSFLLEASLLGAIGAVLGFFLGLLIAGIVAVSQGWAIILPPYTVALPLLGALAGAIGGTLPAVSASRVQPLELLT